MPRRRHGSSATTGRTPSAILPFHYNAMRYLKFDGANTDDQRRYALIQLSFANSQRQNSARDIATIANLVNSMNAIGMVDEKDERGEDDARDPNTVEVAEPMHRLGDEGGTVKLESAEYRMLLELIDGTRWRPTFSVKIIDLNGWLKKARKDKVKAGEEPDDASTE